MSRLKFFVRPEIKISKGGPLEAVELGFEELMTGFMTPQIHSGLRKTCRVRKKRND